MLKLNKLFITILFVLALHGPSRADDGAPPAGVESDSSVSAQPVAEPAPDAGVVPAAVETPVVTSTSKHHRARAKKTSKRGSAGKKPAAKRRASRTRAAASTPAVVAAPSGSQEAVVSTAAVVSEKHYPAKQRLSRSGQVSRMSKSEILPASRKAQSKPEGAQETLPNKPAALEAAPSPKQTVMRAKKELKPAVLKNASVAKRPVRHNNEVMKPAPSKEPAQEVPQAVPQKASLKPATTKSGYIARMLINEAVFPGEDGWVSEENSEAAMLAMLWVCHGRIHHVPPHYTRMEIAATSSTDIIDIITAGGEKGQVDGFYRDKSGAFKCIPRVHERVKGLLEIASRGTPGRIARMLIYAQGLADAYVNEGIRGADRYAGLKVINGVRVTGRAYSWMTDEDYYNPGGDFIRIPNAHDGSLGGNRFFTLKELTQ